MKSFIVFTTAALTLFVTIAALAAPTAPSYTRIKCGDHWFSVSAVLDSKSTQAKVSFSGDSNPEAGPFLGTYVFKANHSLSIILDAKSGARLEIETSTTPNLASGTLYSNAKDVGTMFSFCSIYQTQLCIRIPATMFYPFSTII